MATKSHSAEWNGRVAEALRGRKLSEEHRRAISDGLRRSTCHRQAMEKLWEGNKGRRHTQAAKEKIGVAHRGKVVSEGTRRKIAEAVKQWIAANGNPFAGRKHTDVARRRMSEVRKGKPLHPNSREAAILAAQRPRTEAWKAKMRARLTGRPGHPASDETKRKMADAARGRVQPEKQRRATSARQRGEKNWNWKGGVSGCRRAKGFTTRLASEVRKRDGHRCALCGVDACIVHHIDGNVENNERSNLIILCLSCHGRLHMRAGFIAGLAIGVGFRVRGETV